MPIHHYQFSPVTHNFPSRALYPHGATESFVLSVPYATIYDISEFYQFHIIYIHVLHHIGILTCDSHHNFAAIQGIGCEINCLHFCTLWKGVCTDLFSISSYVCRSEFGSRKKHSYNAPTSSDDEIQGVSSSFLQVLHSTAWSWSSWFLQQVFHPEVVHSAHSSEDKDMLKTYYFKILCLVLSWGSIFSMSFCLFPHFSGHNNR